MFILGIESSCDDTSAAVSMNTTILSNIVSTQMVHKKHGGVVPELASRAHEKNIIPVVERALKDAKVNIEDIDGIAFTKGPGLLGSLLVGASFSKGLALALNKPLLDVHHMKAHILAHFIDQKGKNKPTFPFLCLTVSGGHTQIVIVKDYMQMEVIGKTIDDAAGEAFDKSAKLMGLEYPGGPLIDRYAKNGDPNKFEFAKPKIQGYDFSFSGLKTSFLYFIQKEIRKNPDFIKEEMSHLCASLQKTIVDILIEKVTKAAQNSGINQIAIAGGVSANSMLRSSLNKMAKGGKFDVYIPDFEYCTDNAAMICISGYYLFRNKKFADQSVVCSAKI